MIPVEVVQTRQGRYVYAVMKTSQGCVEPGELMANLKSMIQYQHIQPFCIRGRKVKISQKEIYNLLIKKKGPLTSNEISKLLDIRQETVCRALKKMLKFAEVEARRITKGEIAKRNYDHPEKINSRARVFWIEDSIEC